MAKTYAVDFDGCLCSNKYPEIGKVNIDLIFFLRQEKKKGNKIILWTCRCGERLDEAVKWCESYGLEFDAVNENLKENIELYGSDSRKIFADYYIDDKAILWRMM